MISKFLYYLLHIFDVLASASFFDDSLTGCGKNKDTQKQTENRHPNPMKAAMHLVPRSAEKIKFPTMAAIFPITTRILVLVALNGTGITSTFTAVTILPAILVVTITAAASVSMYGGDCAQFIPKLLATDIRKAMSIIICFRSLVIVMNPARNENITADDAITVEF